MAIRLLKRVGFWSVLFLLVGLAGCNLGEPGTKPPGGSTPDPNIPNGGKSADDLVYEAVVLSTTDGVLSWVRLCEKSGQPISNAKVLVNGRDYPFTDTQPMLFFDRTCAHYEAVPAYQPGKSYRVRITTADKRKVDGTVTAPEVTGLSMSADLAPDVTIPRNQDFVVRWKTSGKPPNHYLVAVLDQTGQRLFAALTDGKVDSYTIAAQDMIGIPPGEHNLWVMALNGIEINPTQRDPVLGVGPGAWAGVGAKIALFFI